MTGKSPSDLGGGHVAGDSHSLCHSLEANVLASSSSLVNFQKTSQEHHGTSTLLVAQRGRRKAAVLVVDGFC